MRNLEGVVVEVWRQEGRGGSKNGTTFFRTPVREFIGSRKLVWGKLARVFEANFAEDVCQGPKMTHAHHHDAPASIPYLITPMMSSLKDTERAAELRSDDECNIP